MGARDPFSNDAPRKITIDVARTTERVEARIQARDEQDNIVADSTAYAPSWRCDQLATRIVFVLRDIVDPLSPPTPTSSQSSPSQPSSATQQGTENDNSPEKGAHPVAEKQPIVLTNRPKHYPAHSKPQIALSLGLGATWWNKPNTAFGSVVGLAAQWSAMSIGIQGRYDYALTLPVEHRAAASQVALAILACGKHSLVLDRFYGRGCLFGDLTRMSVDSEQIRLTQDALFILQGGARLGVGVSIGTRWTLEIQADGMIAAQQPQFVFNLHERWRLPLFNGALRANVVGLFDVF